MWKLEGSLQPVICADPSSLGISVADPDPSVEVRIRLRILLTWSKNCKKNIDSLRFVTCLWLFIFGKWCKCTFKSKKEENWEKKNSFLLSSWRSMAKIACSGSGSISQRNGSRSVPKCHGSATLLGMLATYQIQCIIFRSKASELSWPKKTIQLR